jgi:uncharacterized delta-60 repeat protein
MKIAILKKKKFILVGILVFSMFLFIGCSGSSNSQPAPNPPTDLKATAVSASQINLSWNIPATAEIAGYNIYRNNVLIKTVTGTTASDTGLSEGTTYCYEVSTLTQYNQESAMSNEVCVMTSGSLDTTFNTTGIITTAIGPGNTQAYGVAVQSDGKIVVAGNSKNGSHIVFSLARYNTDGSLDTTFNTTGTVTTAIGTGDSNANGVAIQSDGKIVAAGYAYNGSQIVFALARYNTDGSLDTTFNSTGIVTTSINGVNDEANGVAIQSNGEIVAAGYSQYGSDYEFALARYTTDGALDTTFNVTGIVTTSINGVNDEVKGIAIQSDGKIVVAGSSYYGSYYEFALARYTTSGILDTTFNTTGTVTTAIGTKQASARGVAIQSNGEIVAAGYSYYGSSYAFTLARYTTGGSLDTNFNTTGIVTTTVGTGNASADGVAIQSDGKVVAAGYAYNGGANRVFATARYNTDGSLDTNFNTTGTEITAIETGDAYAEAVAIQTDGKIVVVGNAQIGSYYEFALVRYWP